MIKRLDVIDQIRRLTERKHVLFYIIFYFISFYIMFFLLYYIILCYMKCSGVIHCSAVD